MDRRSFLAGLLGGVAVVTTAVLAARPAAARDISPDSLRLPEGLAPGADEAVELEARRRRRRRRRRGWRLGLRRRRRWRRRRRRFWLRRRFR